MPLFEVVIIRVPTRKEAEEGKLEDLVWVPETIIARDEHGAAFKAAKQSETTDETRLEVLVRPFR